MLGAGEPAEMNQVRFPLSWSQQTRERDSNKLVDKEINDAVASSMRVCEDYKSWRERF